jgi:hypothetical protein
MRRDMQLSNIDIEKLRKLGLIKSDENALKEGDVVIAIEVVSGKRRIVETSNLLLECNKKVLND